MLVVYLGQDSKHQAPTEEGATTDMSLSTKLILPNHCRFLTKVSQILSPRKAGTFGAWDKQPHLLYTSSSVLLLASESHPGPPGSACINSSWICCLYCGQDNRIII